MKNHLSFETTFGPKGSAPRRTDAEPFRILLVGDFSGRRARRLRGETPPLRRPVAGDSEHLERAMSIFQPRLFDTTGREGDTFIEVTSLDDFHPDSLFARISGFEVPRRIRASLRGGGSIEQATKDLEAWLQTDVDPGRVAERPAPVTSPSMASDDDTSSLLARVLGEGGATRQPSAKNTVEALLRDVVRPYVVATPDARHQPLLQILDAALAAAMRAQLARPDFCALEASWRGAHWVASSLDTNEELELFLFDATKEDLADDVISAGGALERSAVHRLLVEGGSRWSVLAIDETFDAKPDELAVLASLGALAARTGAPVLAGTGLALLGCASADAVAAPHQWGPLADETAAFWTELRASPIARHIGLVLPRILLRLPYGKKTDPVESFPFEELPKEAGPDRSLRRWISGAFGGAILLGRAFQSRGWDMEPGDQLEIADLPSHTFEDAGEQQLFPCAEWAFDERTAAKILERGINPVVAHRSRNAVRFLRMQSIADPPAALAGAWGKSP